MSNDQLTGESSTAQTQELENVSRITFTAGCEFIRARDGKLSIAWENGSAVEAVRGAAVDYIDPVYHMAVVADGNMLKYAPASDLGRLLKGGIKLQVAMCVVGMRRVVASFPAVELNIAEVVRVAKDECTEIVDQKAWDTVEAAGLAYRGVLDIAPTILGMNGLSLMQKGHNYIDTDTMWTRLIDAADLEESFTKLGVPDFQGVAFHDALHPFTAEWKVRLAADATSVLTKHCNGVLLKRMPGVPAGTTLVFVTLAALQELGLARPQIQGSIRGLIQMLTAMTNMIRARPLDFCSAFPAAHTQENLTRVARAEPLAAFVYGACTAVFDRKTTVLKSMAFKNNAGKHAGTTAMGRGWGESLEGPEFTDETITRLFYGFTTDLGVGAAPEAEEENVEEDDNDN